MKKIHSWKHERREKKEENRNVERRNERDKSRDCSNVAFIPQQTVVSLVLNFSPKKFIVFYAEIKRELRTDFECQTSERNCYKNILQEPDI